MKKYIYLFILVTLIYSCSQNCQTKNGFGDLRLGMSIDDFNKTFFKALSSNYNDSTYYFNSLQISDDIIVKKAQLSFYKNKLYLINFECHPELLEILKTNGIKRKQLNPVVVTEFKTENKNYNCLYFETPSGKGMIGFADIAILNQEK